jgi:3-methyladenine DNA glycosylase AlkD
MDNYLNALIESFERNRNAETAAAQQRYMRNLFPFLGIKTPLKNQIIKEHFYTFHKPKKENINDYVKFLWNLPEREYVYAAFSILENKRKKLDESDLDLLEMMISTKSWWDSVDGCIHFTGPFFKQHPHLTESVTERWVQSDNIWFQRSALLFQLQYAKTTNFDLLSKYIHKLSKSDEFFIRKAIGWSLRQYSKYEPEIVEDFVDTYPLKNLSKKEALKIINKRKK